MINKIKNYLLNLDKIDKLVILLIFFSLLVRVIFLFNSPLYGWDETVYLNLGHDLSNNPLLYSLQNSEWSDFIPSGDAVYGWPNIGFRAPLLPYIFSFFYFLKLNFLIPLIIPFFAISSVYLFYILGKILFNKKIGLYGAILFSLTPIIIYCGQKVWVDSLVVFFILLTFVSFWKGFELENKKYKILFGLFFALSILARYTAMWIVPVFLIYFILKDKSFKFLKDKYLWFAIVLFFIILIPWFVYGYVYYNNPIGSFIHGFKASTYYGGVQSWNYFFVNSWRIFSVIGLFFTLSLFYIFSKKEFLKREVYLLLIWVIFFTGMALIMPHKEDRYILMAIPPICLLSGLFIDKIGKFKNIIIGVIVIILIISLWNSFKLQFAINNNKSNICFNEGNIFLSRDVMSKDAIIMTNQSPIVHYYTNKKVILYPDDLSIKSIREIINSKYQDKLIYIYFANYEMPMDSFIRGDLDHNFEKVFECIKDYGYSAVYKYK